MAMSKASYNYNRKSWEDAEFPILCQTCLGDNPYLRMMKEKYGKACTICDRPFTTFRWCPGKGMRYKKTEVCQTCAKLKNVCQTCLLDLEYGLPVQVRDYALQIQDEMPKTGANRDFYVQNAEMAMAESGGTTPGGTVGAVMAREGPNELLMKLARTTPYYQRNRPHICSFWVKGECKRGEECPYRHEKPTDPDDPLSDQNIKDRYYGTLDPVAEKMLNRAKAIPVLKPPEDQTITTLYVGNLGEEGYLSEQDLQDYFYQFGEIRSISLLPGKGCGFVQFTSRGAAELAAERTFNKLTLKRRRITVRWGKPQSQQNLNTGLAAAMPGSSGVGYGLASYAAVPGLPGTLPAPANLDFFNLATAGSLPKEDEEDGPSAAKRSRAEIAPPENLDAPAPVKPKPGQAGYAAVAPPTELVRHSANAPPTIHYPSQDPHHLGAKDLQD